MRFLGFRKQSLLHPHAWDDVGDLPGSQAQYIVFEDDAAVATEVGT